MKRASVAAAFLVALVACPAAHAAPRLVRLGVARSFPVSDGERWAAFAVDDGTLIVDGSRRKLTGGLAGLTKRCGDRFGFVGAVGGGFIAIDCGWLFAEQRQQWLVYEIRTGAFAEAAGMSLVDGSEGDQIAAVGKNWISYVSQFHEGQTASYLLQWREGRRVSPPVSPHRVADPNLPTGSRRVCRSIVRPLERNRFFSYLPPFAVSTRGDAVSRRLVLQRCGRPPVTIARSSLNPRDPQLGSRFVTWTQDGSVRARSLRTGRVMSWRTSRARRAPLVVAVQAGRHLLVSKQARNGTIVVYDARLY